MADISQPAANPQEFVDQFMSKIANPDPKYGVFRNVYKQIQQKYPNGVDSDTFAKEAQRLHAPFQRIKFQSEQSSWWDKPLVPLSQTVPEGHPSPAGKVEAGVVRGVAKGAEGLTTPKNIGVMGAMGAAQFIPIVGEAVDIGAGLYFSYEMAKKLVDSIPKATKAAKHEDWGTLGEIVGDDAATAFILGKAGKRVAGKAGSMRNIPEVPRESASENVAEAPSNGPQNPWWGEVRDKSLTEVRQMLEQRAQERSKAAAQPPSVPPDLPGHVKTWASGREGLGARTAAPEGYTFPKTLPGKDTVAAAREEPVTEPGAQHGPPEPSPSHKAQAKAYGERSKPPDFEDVYGEMGKRVSGKYPTKEAAEAYPDIAAKPPAAAPGKPVKPTATEAAPAEPLADQDPGNLNKRREEFTKLQKELKALPDTPQKKDMLAKVSKAIESIDAALKQKKGTSDSKKTDARPAATSGGSKGKIAAGEPALKSAPAGAQKAATPPEPPPSQKAKVEPAKAEPATGVREAVKSILDQVQRAKIDRFAIRVRNAAGEEIFSGEYEGDSSPEYIESAFEYLRGAHKIEIVPLGPNRGIKAWTKFLAPDTVKAPPG